MQRSFSLLRTHSRKFGFRSVLLALFLAMGLIFGVFSFTPEAHAASVSHAQTVVPNATNGVQLLLQTTRAYSVLVEGPNQGNNVVAHCFPTPGIYTLTTGWYWKSTSKSAVYTSSFASNNCSGALIKSSLLIPGQLVECFIAWSNVPTQYPGNSFDLDLQALDC